MMRCASSASSGRTAILTSPSSLTFRGNTVCATAEDRIAITPCDSSSPRTMLASTLDWVRKMTTGSAKSSLEAALSWTHLCDLGDLCHLCVLGSASRIHLQQDHRHVVVLRRVADEGGDLAQDAFAQLVGGEVSVLLDQ